ncbi:nucleotide-diphospho-sugar transferase [Chytriomyces sp. MP71]|nr:nucleotide-diphospho-sugar transferase [Chytriomyces sp. MP71]
MKSWRKPRQILALLVLACLAAFLFFAELGAPLDTSEPALTSNVRFIPKIIHQSWKTADVPKKHSDWVASWKIMNPGYEYILWTDDDNRNLVATHYPWFLKTYDAFNDPILRADASRLFYMHKYGGIYADLDFECLKPLDGLLKSHQAVIGSMTTGGDDAMRIHGVPNAWMASRPGHPLWLRCARRVMRLDSKDKSVETRTGPVMLFWCLKDYRRKLWMIGGTFTDTLVLADLLYPFSWLETVSKEVENACLAMRSETLNRTRCLNAVDPERKAYAITYWGHSWTEPYYLDEQK